MWSNHSPNGFTAQSGLYSRPHSIPSRFGAQAPQNASHGMTAANFLPHPVPNSQPFIGNQHMTGGPQQWTAPAHFQVSNDAGRGSEIMLAHIYDLHAEVQKTVADVHGKLGEQFEKVGEHFEKVGEHLKKCEKDLAKVNEKLARMLEGQEKLSQNIKTLIEGLAEIVTKHGQSPQSMQPLLQPLLAPENYYA